MVPINRPITRDTGVTYQRQHLVIRITREGVYIKGMRQRWGSAALVDWASLASVGWKIRAKHLRYERAAKRRVNTETVLWMGRQ